MDSFCDLFGEGWDEISLMICEMPSGILEKIGFLKITHLVNVNQMDELSKNREISHVILQML